MYFVYVLKSQKDHKKYVGQTDNIERRLRQHNSGKVRSTKYRLPFDLIYHEEFKTRTEAVDREKFFKSHKGYNFLKKMGIG